MDISNNIKEFLSYLSPNSCRLVAVSKTKPPADIQEAYEAGQRIFGENKAQEMTEKSELLPKDIEWHMIGHLQRNKVKYIAPYVSLIHAVDSIRLLSEINKQGSKIDRLIPCLLQIHIAEEETKFGLSEEELILLLNSDEVKEMENVKIAGLMGMATNTDDEIQVRKEFKGLKRLFDQVDAMELPGHVDMKELSMGMSGDYTIAIEEGSTLIRVGSAIFGARNYTG
ncbi:YggS family pyridoxal phosphate-dependent enzyme [Fulvivirga sp. M361]|uniref:YggS family pyridoxal phosphate-dependent enzyme n=1 Tax=Fulvivirga sp. M361 TaxID=2594266 RepID=UPI00117B10CA|nr:YggS family pyridoxal phosphate-dependent enzyme [Fulvivirga sp. M361]TRX49842.1 YggS family pyridoxal phosphate-dependent enzyme [Fulvivirga sp. M361]